MSQRLASGICAISLACSMSSSQPDWQVYAQTIAKESPTEADMRTCDTLQDRTLAGDCSLTIATRLSRQGDVPLQTSCPQVSPGVWQEECYFVAAERARSAGQVPTAIKLCQQSGQFAPDCAFHLWQRAMRSLAQRIVLETMAEQQDRMRSQHQRWSERVGSFSNFDSIYWRKLFRAIWDGVSRVDPVICDVLDPDLIPKCRIGAQIHLDHAIRASLRQDEWGAAFCATQSPKVSELQRLPSGFPELDRFPDHPFSQGIVDTFHRAHCAGEPLPDHPDPPRRKMTTRERSAPDQDLTAPPTQSK